MYINNACAVWIEIEDFDPVEIGDLIVPNLPIVGPVGGAFVGAGMFGAPVMVDPAAEHPGMPEQGMVGGVNNTVMPENGLVVGGNYPVMPEMGGVEVLIWLRE